MGRLTVDNALQHLASHDKPYKLLFAHGSLEVEFYQPKRIDRQRPHTRDEIYVIARGSGWFVNGNTRQPVETGEVLFVAAYAMHRFEDFSEDFGAWVFFYGPEGGEVGQQ